MSQHPRLTTVLRAVTVVAATALLAVLPTATAHAYSSTTYENDVLRYTNSERTSRKLVALKAQSCVDKYAERQASAMAKQRKIYHQSLQPILTECKLRSVGENVASGFPTGRDAVRGWMNSPGHRANILNTGYRLHGVGAVKGADGRWYSAVVFGTLR